MKIKLTIILFLSFVLTGCISTREMPSKEHIQILSLPLSIDKKNIKNNATYLAEDKHKSLQSLEKNLPNKKIEYKKGYVLKNLAPLYQSSNTSSIINHISKGNLIYIYDEKNSKYNISNDSVYPFWISKEDVCFSEKCWIKPLESNNLSKVKTTILDNDSMAKKYPDIPKTKNDAPSKKVTSAPKKNISNVNKGYINKDGKFVPSPTKSNKKPVGATAKCRDNSWSFSQSRRGTCSGHGGVASWL